MVKNILKKFYLTDEYEDDDNMTSSVNHFKEKSGKKSKLDKFIESKIDDDSEVPKIEFIVEEDENNEKQIRMNFEFKISDSNEVIKIDLEISKSTYLEIANELLK